MDTPLFGDDVPSTPPRSPLLRKALDARGLTDQQARRSLIEQHVGRSLASLRELTSEEALQVITALGRKAPQNRTGSQWDDREDDTWIDRL